MDRLTRKLKLLRIKKGMMQKEVAENIGITPSSYSYYEAGKRIPSPDTLKKIAEYYDISVENLLECDERTEDNIYSDKRIKEVIEDYITIYKKSPYNQFSKYIKAIDLNCECEDVTELYDDKDIALGNPIRDELNMDSLKDAMKVLLMYSNKCSMPNLTEFQLDAIFDKTIDYIKYQLYQLDRG